MEIIDDIMPTSPSHDLIASSPIHSTSVVTSQHQLLTSPSTLLIATTDPTLAMATVAATSSRPSTPPNSTIKSTRRRSSSRKIREKDDSDEDEGDEEDYVEEDDDSPLPKKTKSTPSSNPKPKTKWSEYVTAMKKLLTNKKKLEKKTLYEEAELVSQEIKGLLQVIMSENSSHTRFPQIATAQEDGFSVDNITCSKCHGPDTELNDLYFCDNLGCNRAYHRQCLEPPLSYTEINSNPSEDWFCHQCTCLAECLYAINRSCRTKFMTPEECLGAEIPVIKSLLVKEEKKEPSARKGRRSTGSSQKIIPLEISYTESGPSLVYAPNSFWGQKYTLIKRLVGDIVRFNHFVTVVSTQSQADAVVLADDLQRYLSLLRRRKMEVREALIDLCSANRDHTRYPQLDQDDEDGMVDVGEILCSKCGGTDTPTNDIYICDRKGCCRAYHAYCLDPPLNPSDISNKPDEDWFCWECRCLADCLVAINEALGTTYDGEATEVFSEVAKEIHDNPLDENDEEDDTEYTPKNGTAEEHEGSDEGSDSDSDASSVENEDADKHDSEVSDDEVHHLLAEAGAEILDITSPNPITPSKDRISSRLRKKTPKSADQVALPEGMIPLSKLKESDVKDDFPVAVVKGGKVVLGEVKSVSQRQPIRYTIQFEDDSEEIVSWILLKERYRARLDYESFVAKAEASKIVAPDELVSAENILEGRRPKPRLNYAKLLEEVYGDQPESDDDDYDESENSQKPAPPRKQPKPPQVINTVYSPPPAILPLHQIPLTTPPPPPAVAAAAVASIHRDMYTPGKRKERDTAAEEEMDALLVDNGDGEKRMKITAVDFDSI